jgi:hypothetical protein
MGYNNLWRRTVRDAPDATDRCISYYQTELLVPKWTFQESVTSRNRFY